LITRIRNNWDKYYDDINVLYTNEPVIKILGDVFESIIGAIFLDCRLNYELIKKVLLNLLEEKFMKHFLQRQLIAEAPLG
jgi:dsRNA-specific ribonuclease